ncbi:hypothetical protein CONLIGDRAFT_665957 [Coniochaeta ligniaria NRRL 30616]|uniref:Uncharacterized protein n=1 Tax=Coniochaeta ligniaria NRRL 30616 TaxID=1408157 RepID=A0A1J7JYW3_9PEZI|nr:hypothetical protein CONLIGDRAFT_665957 [Coniochaeta ligniaria NRRL 30616]
MRLFRQNAMFHLNRLNGTLGTAAVTLVRKRTEERDRMKSNQDNTSLLSVAGYQHLVFLASSLVSSGFCRNGWNDDCWVSELARASLSLWSVPKEWRLHRPTWERRVDPNQKNAHPCRIFLGDPTSTPSGSGLVRHNGDLALLSGQTRANGATQIGRDGQGCNRDDKVGEGKETPSKTTQYHMVHNQGATVNNYGAHEIEGIPTRELASRVC